MTLELERCPVSELTRSCAGSWESEKWPKAKGLTRLKIGCMLKMMMFREDARAPEDRG